MTSNQSALGRCPTCDEEIPGHRLLIEYRSGDRRAMFAECPSCLDVVHPH